MGDDEETFSSNINKPSLEQVSENLVIEEIKLNTEKCEFVPNSDDSNASAKESEDVAVKDELETEALAVEVAEEKEEAVEGGAEEMEDVHGTVPFTVEEEEAVEGGTEEMEDVHGTVPFTVDVEMKTEAEEVVGGGEKLALVADEGSMGESNMEFLEEKVCVEKSDSHSADIQETAPEGRAEVLVAEMPVPDAELKEEEVSGGGGQTGVSGVGDHEVSSVPPVNDAEEVETAVETVGFQEEEVTVGDGEENASDTVDLQVEETTVGDAEKNVSNIDVAAIGEAKTVVETVDLQEEETTVGDEEKNVCNMGGRMVAAVEEAKVIVETVELQVEGTADDAEENACKPGISLQLSSAEEVSFRRNNDMVVDEAVPVFEGDKSIIESENLQSIAIESVVVEEDAKVVVMPVESSSVVATDVKEGEESSDGKESVEEEVLVDEKKVEMETSTEVTEVTEGENVTRLQALQFVDTEAPNLVEEENDKVRGTTDEECLVANAEMDDRKEIEDVRGRNEIESIVAGAEMDSIEKMEAFENSVPNDLHLGVKESVTLVNKEESKESFPEEGVSAAGTATEKETVAEEETTKFDDVESTPKIADSPSVVQEEEDEEVVADEELALEDTELETETDVGESSKGVGEKRRRGKNSKNMKSSKIVTRGRKTMEEDVCFICFDGGDLVLCDRRYVCCTFKLNSYLIKIHSERDR